MSLLWDATLKGALILLVALGAMPLLRRQSAALRHLVLAAALLAATLAPAASLVTPSWHLPVRLAAALPSIPTPAGAPSAEAPPLRAARTSPSERSPSAVTGMGATDVIAGLWATGVVASLLVLASGLARLAWMMRRARRLTDGVWVEQAAALADRLGLRRPVRLLETTHPTLLATVGIVHPTILVPASAAGWSDRRVSLVLAHELAHVQRADWVVQLGAEILRAWQWFNPIAWMACARLRHESEQACDDVVLSAGVEADAYAGQLVAIARELRAVRPWVPALSIARPSGLERRIAHMLTAEINRRPVTRSAALATCAVALAILLPIAGLAAQAARASVGGSVADPQNGLLPNVTLVLTHSQSQARREVRSDSTGRFSFAGLEPGDYLLEAQMPGFAAFRSTLTVAGDDRSVQQDLKLDLGTIQETITVRESATGARAPATVRPVDQDAFRALEERRQKRAAQQCTTAPLRPTPFIGGNIRVPNKYVDVKPEYPEALRVAGVAGSAVLSGRIGKDGLVDELTVVSATHPAFATAATEAVSRWQFDATLLNCVAMDTSVTVNVTFDLER